MPEAAAHPNESAARKAVRFEWGLALALTLAAGFLHLTFFQHADGLWRDEAGVVRLATLPDFGEMWSALAHESCPVLFPAAIRAWSALGLGTDPGLRAYGFLTGLLLIGAVWLNGRWLARSAPLLALGLLAANLAAVRWGGSLRAYGTGSVLMLLAVAFAWRFVQQPSRGRWLLAALAALLSVQCLFQNAFLVLAVCVAGGATAWLRRDKPAAAAALALGLPAALSLLAYLPAIRRAQDWSVLSQTGFQPGRIGQNLSECLSAAAPWALWVWIGLVLLAVARAAWILRLNRRTGADGSRRREEADSARVSDDPPPDVGGCDSEFFAGTALAAGVVSFFVYLWLSALPTQVWYFLPLMTFAAVCVDAALAGWLPRRWTWRWLLPCLLAGLAFPRALEMSRWQQTNVDVIAAKLREQARPDDLVLVHPWVYGISFNRYYDGPAPWTTMPPLADHRFHRYDLLKIQLQLENPIQPVLDRVAATLQSGHRVWIIGKISLDESPPEEIRPAPDNPWGWLDRPYSIFWGEKMGHFIVTHITAGDVVVSPPTNSVNALEHLPLVWVSGWKEAPAGRK